MSYDWKYQNKPDDENVKHEELSYYPRYTSNSKAWDENLATCAQRAAALRYVSATKRTPQPKVRYHKTQHYEIEDDQTYDESDIETLLEPESREVKTNPAHMSHLQAFGLDNGYANPELSQQYTERDRNEMVTHIYYPDPRIIEELRAARAARASSMSAPPPRRPYGIARGPISARAAFYPYPRVQDQDLRERNRRIVGTGDDEAQGSRKERCGVRLLTVAPEMQSVPEKASVLKVRDLKEAVQKERRRVRRLARMMYEADEDLGSQEENYQWQE